jgi:DEAD/DEAH box helicase domain-containing protein
MRLGLTPDSPKLRILTTTASLDNNDQGRRFLREFFGRDNFHFVSGEQIQPQAGARTRLRPYQDSLATFAKAVQPDIREGPPSEASSGHHMATLATRLGEPENPGLPDDERLGHALTRIGAPDAIRDACQEVNGTVRPTKVPDIDAQLFPSKVAETATEGLAGVCSDAMRGLLLALGMSQDKVTGRSPQPVRGHLFFHNLQNMWVCCNPECTDPNIIPLQRSTLRATQKPTVGAIHPANRLACSCGSRVLDLIVCEVCGDAFLGGFRAESGGKQGKTTILTADQPDLENMPDRVSLSQRHSQYAVFWPLPFGQPWSIRPVATDWTMKGLKYRWTEAKIDCVTGELRINAIGPKPGEVPGWLYSVDGKDSDRSSSMPVKCPRCDADYRYRKTNKTPLRNHRTGFQKATQVLSSALFREMTPGTADGPDSARKLVIFSDSRQDAAKLAAGIERDHYRDMLRLVLIQTFRSYWEDFVSYTRVMLARNPVALEMVQSLNPELHAELVKGIQDHDLRARQRFQASTDNAILLEARDWADDVPTGHEPARNEWLSMVQTYPGRVPLQALRGKIFDTLLSLGMNPGSPSFNATWYKASGHEASMRKRWYTCFDWSSGQPASIVNAGNDIQSHLTRLRDLLMSEIMYALFPHMARTFEGLGQGWVSYRPVSNPLPDIVGATDAVIRQLGVRRMQEYAQFFYAGDNDKLKTISTNYLNHRDLTPPEIVAQLKESGAGISSGSGLSLAPDKLTLVPVKEASDGETQGYRCPDCNGFYLHNVVICPECDKTPPVSVVPSAAGSDFDYYTAMTSGKGATHFRMNSEELTGQTDRNQRTKRQRWFQEIFIGDDIPRVEGVDLLSVTTTMEAGVDIGALNAVMMANMPPRRFNYQQRVGRAGRRASGVSLAVTFCRGRSHDDFYFQRPEMMTGDPPPPPYVDMASEPIFKRVLVKEVLRRAFETIGIPGNTTDNVHGEFGEAVDWPTREQEIRGWLNAPEHEDVILSIVDALLPGTAWSSERAESFRDSLLQYVRSDLIPALHKVATDPSYTQPAMSERAANAGLLPMFGFPTRVRILYTRWPRSTNPWPPEEGTVDRNLDVAISQFAPGSQTVKDKAVHTAMGVVELIPQGPTVQSRNGFDPPLPEGNQHPVGLCDACQAVLPLAALSSPPAGSDEPVREHCTVCKASEPTVRVLDAREPLEFFTDLSPQDFEGQFEWSPRSSRPSLGINKPETGTITVGNVEVSPVVDRIISINDNGGQGGFNFRPAKIYGKPFDGAYAVSDEDEGGATSNVSVYGPSWRVALMSRRVTDALLMGIRVWPEGIFADPMSIEGRAAWYSFAFMLRLAGGAELDVDPQELQASFRSREEAGRAIGEAFLCDQLENGAGYCRELARPERFQNLLAQANPSTAGSIGAKWSAVADEANEGPPHAMKCDTSCNRCLRDFQNMSFHGLLDWRLAMDMARIAATGEGVDLTSDWNGIANPWHRLVDGSDSEVAQVLGNLGFGEQVRFGKLHGYVNNKRQLILIERHPLWQIDHPLWLEAQTDALRQHAGYTVRHSNPYRVLRRPADCVADA